MFCNQVTYVWAAAAIAADDGPVHRVVVKAAITELYWAAAECNSAASSSQAAAAASSDPAPGPAYIRPELISGGNKL
ncbi:hypothetical protein MBOT_08810 [Mycobacterium botniense]|uniref:Uncharacterized protein n=1 Tax=Mycobacterium botniense TaxID=84962 RepID=A0A7I9XV94_9MYCO|nr:hypothetical protein MBOT_08810 [Mycobacterium botniense]